MSYQDFLLEIKKQIPKKYTPNSLLAEMGELISEKQKHFVKIKLVDEVLGYIDFALFDANA